MEFDLVIARVGELILKSSGVRRLFEAQLTRNVKAALKLADTEFDAIERGHARIFIYTPEVDEVMAVLKNIFGIANFSPAVEIGADLDTIRQVALEVALQAGLSAKKSFAIRARRVTKDFRLSSHELNEDVGAFVKQRTKAAVNLRNPDINIGIDIIGRKSFVFTETIKGLGGLPVGVSGKVVCLVSGGIDSPVAVWTSLKRGCEILPLHFRLNEIEHNKFLRLCEQLQRYCSGHKIKPLSVRWDLKLGRIRCKLEKLNKLGWTCVFCKAAMLKEAQKLAQKEGALAIVTGSSIGQVASQTLSNIAVIQQGLKLPVLHPLIGLNKEEVEQIAKRIGTFDISIKEAVPCQFVPKHPVTHARLEQFKKIKKALGG